MSNREAWLTELGEQLLPLFKGYELGKFKITCGWPLSGGMGMRRRVLGQCFGVEWSTDKTHHLFISPLIADSVEVAGVTTHEMAHIAAGVQAAHGKGFKRVCVHIGLTRNKPTSAAPGEQLTEHLSKLVSKMGIYPHTALQPVLRKSKPSVVTKLECPDCGCAVTISNKWLNEVGAPTCACGSQMVSDKE